VDAEEFGKHRFEVHHGAGATRLKKQNKIIGAEKICEKSLCWYMDISRGHAVFYFLIF
jgi:hypothetical protein